MGADVVTELTSSSKSEEGRVQIWLESEAFVGERLPLLELDGVEALNQPYRFKGIVQLASEDVDATLLFGVDAAVIWQRGTLERRLPGICQAVEDLGAGHAHVTLVPAIMYAALGRATRVFQAKSAKAILEEILAASLAPYGREVQLELEVDPPVREYCVQYDESDLAFAERLMEEEGISYGFDFTGENELLVLRDTNAGFPLVPTVDDGVVPYDAQTDGHAAGEALSLLSRVEQTTETAVTVRDHDWTIDGLTIEGSRAGEDARGRVRESYEHGAGRSAARTGYDGGIGRYQANDVARQARLRGEAYALPTLAFEGRSRAIGFSAGASFALRGHPDLGFDGKFVLLRVEHHASSRDRDDAWGGAQYENRFACVPFDVRYRPPRTRLKPAVGGAQTAIVTGPSGEEVHVDQHGRIKVQFHWDREGTADETSSCWVRVSEAWAGAGWGAVYHPRIGMEVLVSFLHGDPDRPLVTGCLYTGTNPPPYTLPDDKTKSTIKSNSSLGGDGFNELRFEDRAGSEQFYLHAQKDLDEVVENNHTTTVGGDQFNVVKNNQIQTIHNNQAETVKANQEMTVGGDRKVTVGAKFAETVLGGETRSVSAGSTETVLGGETHLTVGATTELIDGGETRTVIGGFTETLIGGMTQVVTGPATYLVTGMQNVMAVGDLTCTTAAGFSLTSGGPTTLVGVAGGKFTAPPFIVLISGQYNRAENFWDKFSMTTNKITGVGVATDGLKLSVGAVGIGGGGIKISRTGLALGVAGLTSSISMISADFVDLTLTAGPDHKPIFAFTIHL